MKHLQNKIDEETHTYLIDSYRKDNKIVLWLKSGDKNLRLEGNFTPLIYSENCEAAKKFLEEECIHWRIVRRKTYMREWIDVIEIPIRKPEQFERFIRAFERRTRHRVALYDADIAPEQMYLYAHDLRPCWQVFEHNGRLVRTPKSGLPELTVMQMKVVPSGPIENDSVLHSCIIDKKRFEGKEESILKNIVQDIRKKDPDIILLDFAFSRLPYLYRRMDKNGITPPFHRWDPKPIQYRGGRSFFTYGQVRYADYAVRLNGRFLIDAQSTIGQECDPKAISELCQLTGHRFQHVASRSFGAAFQQSLVRIMVEKGMLVPYKEKPIDMPISMAELVKADRAGHTLDSKTGFHKRVAAIDFTSLYPWLIFNHNISAETILSDEDPFEKAPGIPVRASLRRKGIVPQAIKPILDRRMHYKRDPTALNRRRAAGLKWILVTSYGYLRFREFKLGLASSHMAIGAYAREIIIKAMNMAHAHGFEVVHGIVDSLYIKKDGLSEPEARAFCRELELETGVPVSFDGILKWAVFLPSVNDSERPLPAKYYGVFESGKVKARGLEVRQRSAPLLVKRFQEAVLETMAKCSTKEEIVNHVSRFGKMMRKVIAELDTFNSEELACHIRISKQEYANDIPQKRILKALRRRGYKPVPGQTISFVHSARGAVLPEDYDQNQMKPDDLEYEKLLVRALYALLQPFGFERSIIQRLAKEEFQMQVTDWLPNCLETAAKALTR